jgi:predicted transcriptional regulator YdeE
MGIQKEDLCTISLLGIATRTSNAREMDPKTAQIGGMVAAYFGNHYAEKIKARTKPGVTYCVYTDYESDFQGEYTYFIGEAVDSMEDQDFSSLSTVTIPSGTYFKHTTAIGVMPHVVIEGWQRIWSMSANDWGAERSYLADFEVYDERASDPLRTQVDIFIGLKS